MFDDVVDLLKSVPEPPMSVDPYAAMALARRKIRMRRIITAAVVAIAIVVVAGSAIVAGRERALPALPPPANVTTSTTPRSLVARFDSSGDNLLTATLDPAAKTITVQGPGSPASSNWALSVPDAPGRASCQVSTSLLVQVCAVRAPVRAGIFTYIDPGASGAIATPPVVGRFSVPGVSVVASFASAADVPWMRGALYELEDGTVADSSGMPVPQARARRVPATVFASGRIGARVMGLRSENSDEWTASTPDGSGLMHTGLGDPTGDYYAYQLPPGGVSGRVRAPGSAAVVAQEILVLGGRKVLVAYLTGVKHFQGPAVDWVDASGDTHILIAMSGVATT